MKPGVGIVGRGEPRSSTAAQPRGTPRRGWFRGEGAGEAHRGVATPRPVPAWLTTGPARSLRAGLVLGLTALLALGAALRCFEYDETYLYMYLAGLPKPDWPLEPRTVAELRGWIDGQRAGPLQVVQDLVRHQTHPPLHFWLMIPWLAPWGFDNLAARLFSVLCGAASMLVAWRLAAVARVPGLPAVACTFLAYAVFYPATLARAYALALLLVLLGALALALLLRDAEEGRRRDGAWLAAGAGLAFGLAGLSHYLALIAGAALGGAFALTMLAQRRAWPVLAAALGGLPPFLLVLAVRADQVTVDWFHPDFVLSRDAVRVVEMVAAALFARTPVLLDAPWKGLATVLVAPCLLLVGGTVLFGIRHIMADPVRRVLLAGALAMPAGLFVLGALTDRAPFVSRYASYSVPFLAICFAAGLGRLGAWRPRLAAAVFGYVLLWQAVGAGSQVAWTATQQEFRLIVSEVARRWVPGQSVLLVPAGYDGIGKNGPYLWEAPPDWPMAVVALPGDQSVGHLGSERNLFLVTFVELSGEWILDRLRPALREQGWRLTETAEYLEVWSR